MRSRRARLCKSVDSLRNLPQRATRRANEKASHINTISWSHVHGRKAMQQRKRIDNRHVATTHWAERGGRDCGLFRSKLRCSSASCQCLSESDLATARRPQLGLHVPGSRNGASLCCKLMSPRGMLRNVQEPLAIVWPVSSKLNNMPMKRGSCGLHTGCARV